MCIRDSFLTHHVDNQVPAVDAIDLYRTDTVLREAVAREGAAWADADLSAFGAVAGGEMMALGFAANENRPRLKAFDRVGRRLDEVEFHPAYHRLMQLGMRHGVHAYA